VRGEGGDVWCLKKVEHIDDFLFIETNKSKKSKLAFRFFFHADVLYDAALNGWITKHRRHYKMKMVNDSEMSMRCGNKTWSIPEISVLR